MDFENSVGRDAAVDAGPPAPRPHPLAVHYVTHLRIHLAVLSSAARALYGKIPVAAALDIAEALGHVQGGVDILASLWGVQP